MLSLADKINCLAQAAGRFLRRVKAHRVFCVDEIHAPLRLPLKLAGRLQAVFRNGIGAYGGQGVDEIDDGVPGTAQQFVSPGFEPGFDNYPLPQFKRKESTDPQAGNKKPGTQPGVEPQTPRAPGIARITVIRSHPRLAARPRIFVNYPGLTGSMCRRLPDGPRHQY